jgi:hypothetical protein
MSEIIESGGSADGHVGLEGVCGDSGAPASSSDVDKWLASIHSTDIFEGLDAFDLSDSDGDLEVDPVGSEEPSSGTSPFNQELALAALSNIPKPGAAQRRKKDEQLRNLSAEDFEAGVERLSFEIIKANIDALFDRKRKASDLVAAAMWVFGRNDEDVSFDTCCQTLCARKDVLRLRIHYEFWRKWYVFPVEFPFMIDPVPDAIDGEIYMVADEEGADLARIAWRQPGIRTSDLIRLASRGTNTDSYRHALELLADKYLISMMNDSWYLTGRNPMLRAIDLAASPYRTRLNQISWSKQF